jgi:hypothetical protein
MFGLKRLPCIAESEMLPRLLGLEMGSVLIQEMCQARGQRPETNDGR